MNVDLPAPLAPIRPTTSPGRHRRGRRRPRRSGGRSGTETCSDLERVVERSRDGGTHGQGDRGLGRRGRRTVRRSRAGSGCRAASRASARSRRLNRIWTNPPGKYSRRMSTPAPLVSRATSGLSGKNAGSPTTKRAAEDHAGDRRQPADDGDRDDDDRVGGHEPVGRELHEEAHQRRARQARQRPGEREGEQLDPRRRDPTAAAASSLSRTASSERPSPLRRTLATTMMASTRRPRQKK